MCRNAQQEKTAGDQMFPPGGQRLAVVFDMFEHFEGANGMVRRVSALSEMIDDLPATQRPEPRLRYASRAIVELNAEIFVPRREPYAKRALAGSDLEHTPSGRDIKTPANRIEPEPGAHCQLGRARHAILCFILLQTRNSHDT
jgi:hypothetical protein